MYRGRGYILFIVYAALVILPIAALRLGGGHEDGTAEVLAKSLALAGLSILFFQTVLVSRIKWLERPYGLDVLVRFHRNMAIFATCLLIAHPLLMAYAKGSWRLLYSLDFPWYIIAAKIALILVVVMVVVAYLQPRLPVGFELWRLGHDIVAPAILVLGFLHSWVIGVSDESALLQVIWWVYLGLAVVVFAWHRFFQPWKLAQNPFTVSDVRQEAPGVWTLEMAPPEGVTPDYLPGQFHFLTLKRGRGLPEEEHHFTISSSPANPKAVASTIKESGDFTATIGKTEPGDPVTVDGAYGRFSCEAYPEERELVFIAGGIGITPIMSMLRYLRDKGRATPVTLLYANSTEKDIVFRDELAEMEQGEAPKLDVAHVISHPEGEWQGETGHIDKEKLQKYAGSFTEKTGFYVCGPTGLRENVVSALLEMGVGHPSIHMEIFTFME